MSPSRSSSPSPVVAVDRALSDLRRGGAVLITGDAPVLAAAAEAATPDLMPRLTALAGTPPALALTGRRAHVLGLTGDDSAPVVLVHHRDGWTAEQVQHHADPLTSHPDPVSGTRVSLPERDSPVAAAVQLAKHARLLPAALVAPVDTPTPAVLAAEHGLLTVTADQVLGHETRVAQGLSAVSEARVPLVDAENTRIIAFRPEDGGAEHLAIVVGPLRPAHAPVLVRLHSECFTGDLLGSMRCDCGDQLRGALRALAAEGGGVLIYLAQEGRGIGLVNKLRAYRLQDAGFDTIDANLQLGFDDDERVYLPAVEILRRLGVAQVRLLTNNPLKVEALRRHGLDVVERVRHAFPANGHNEPYLRAKAQRAGHLF